jgi:hypothetical protein
MFWALSFYLLKIPSNLACQTHLGNISSLVRPHTLPSSARKSARYVACSNAKMACAILGFIS